MTKYRNLFSAACWVIGFAMLPVTAACAAGNTAADGDATPVAMVMAINGSTVPVLTLHQEMAAGAHVALAPDARVSILHYKACSIFTVMGGSVNVKENAVDASAGTMETKAGPCPRVHRVVAGGPVSSGTPIILRSVPRSSGAATSDGVKAQLALKEEILLVGAKAGRATSAEVLDAKGARIEGPIQARDATIPLADAKLIPGDSYVLSIRFQGVSEPVRIPFSVSSLGVDGSFILRLD
jgi:hypothetical protein